jgi:hypothetical protein
MPTLPSDRAVLAAYGWPADLPVEELLARLLALNSSGSPPESPTAPEGGPRAGAWTSPQQPRGPSLSPSGWNRRVASLATLADS